MKKSPLEKAINTAGGVTALARALGTVPQCVNNWRKRGIPAERVLAIEAATAGTVTRHELRPDIYP